ncbi:MAG: winged helix-turn-helix transcriptional regulator [Acidobacteriaceae bacterium]|nr:winged helix-turn-helix transcriptional regulator [Acidobacteriaceae bacterium]
MTRGGQFVRLTAKEYALLECLARDSDTILGREAISERVWDETYDPFSKLVEEYIKRLRGKIDFAGEQPLIQALMLLQEKIQKRSAAPSSRS